MSVIVRKIRTGLDLLAQGEVYLFISSMLANIFPPSAIGMGKFYLYSNNAEIPTQHNDFNSNFLIEIGNVRDLYKVAQCFGTTDPNRAIVGFKRFFENEGELWIARDTAGNNENIAGVVWVFRNKYLIPFEGYDNYSIRLNIGLNNAFIATVHVNTDYRRHGIFSHMMKHIKSSCQELNFFSAVDANNQVSILAHKKLVFKNIGRTYFLRIFSKTFCYFSIPGKTKKIIKLEKGTARDIQIDM